MLEVKSISVHLGLRKILCELSFRLEPGQVMAVLGPNGAGKSTLLRAITGVLPVRQGEILLGGRSISQLSFRERARWMSVVPQAKNLPQDFTVYQTVLLGRTPYLNWQGEARTRDHEIVKNALAWTQLENFTRRKVGELSGGEQQRVLLARALAQQTPILLLDEPTTYLDLHHQTQLLNLVRSLAVEKQIAVLMVLHDPNLAGLYADEVIFLSGGKIRASGIPAQVLTSSILSEVYQIPVRVFHHPEYETPFILPDRCGQMAQEYRLAAKGGFWRLDHG